MLPAHGYYFKMKALPSVRSSGPRKYMYSWITLSEINHWMNVDISHHTNAIGKPTLNLLSTTSSQCKKVKRMSRMPLGRIGIFSLWGFHWEISTFIQWFISESVAKMSFILYEVPKISVIQSDIPALPRIDYGAPMFRHFQPASVPLLALAKWL